jgi:4-hydroxybenzoate polyprenyltransferase
MGNISKWIWCGCVAVMAIVGLFVAARGGHSVPYWGGLAFVGFAIAFIFYMIKRGYDEAEGRH